MGVYTFILDDKVVSELKQWVISKYGKLHKKLSKAVEQAIKEFLEKQKRELVIEGKPEVVSKFARATMKAVAEAALEAAKEKGKISDEEFEKYRKRIVGDVDYKDLKKILREEKGPEEGAPQKSGEISNSKTEEFLFGIADKDPNRALRLIFGIDIPAKITFSAFAKLLMRKCGFSEDSAIRFARKLIDKGIYKQNASLLIYREGE